MPLSRMKTTFAGLAALTAAMVSTPDVHAQPYKFPENFSDFKDVKSALSYVYDLSAESFRMFRSNLYNVHGPLKVNGVIINDTPAFKAEIEKLHNGSRQISKKDALIISQTRLSFAQEAIKSLLAGENDDFHEMVKKHRVNSLIYLTPEMVEKLDNIDKLNGMQSKLREAQTLMINLSDASSQPVASAQLPQPAPPQNH